MRFNARASENEAENYKQQVMEKLGATGSFKELEGHIDPTSGEVNIRYNLHSDTHLPEGDRKALLNEIHPKSGIRVTLTKADVQINTRPEALRGGTAASGCTTGFTIWILSPSAPKKGILNAAHCSDYPGNPTGSAYPLLLQAEHSGPYGEPQALRSDDPTVHNHIRINQAGTQTRFITAYAYPSRGTSICNYGRSRTSYDCTTVREVGVSFWFVDEDGNSVYIGRMARSNGSFTNPGDSGGPWFNGTQAIGVHFGITSGYGRH